ncbi:MAG: hypothetical protein JOS17DRAFT_795366 [Linnemannia elongata]|nr:MAG: hypothetical protein JOS17DRAFT_795366 [Linnemannia elongata]
MSSTSSATIETTVVGRYTYTLPTSTFSYSPNPNNKVLIDPDYKPPGYQRSSIILITFCCLVLLGTLIGSTLYWFRYRVKWWMEEKEAFEIVYPRDKVKLRNSRGLEGDDEDEGESGGVIKSRWSVRRPESAVVVDGVKGAKRQAFPGHRVSNYSINYNSRPQSQQQLQLPQQQLQQRQDDKVVEKENHEMVKVEITPGQSNALEAERWMEEDRQRYQELSELIKSPAFVRQHQALLLQQPFQLQSSVGQSPSFSQSLHSQSPQPLHSQSLQSQQQILLHLQEALLQQHQNLQEQEQQEQHQRQQDPQQQQQQKEQQGTSTRKLGQLPLGLYDQSSRKNRRAGLSRASSKWAGGMDSLSPTLSTLPPSLPSILSLSAAPSAASTMPLSVGNGVRLRASQPLPGLSRLPTVHTSSYLPPPPATPPTTTPVRPFHLKIGGAHYCLTPDLTIPSPPSSSAPRSSLHTAVASSPLQSSLHSIPTNMSSFTQPWKNGSAYAFPTPPLTSSLNISDDGDVQTPQSLSPIESGPIPHGVNGGASMKL